LQDTSSLSEFYSEDRLIAFPRNVGNHVPNNTALGNVFFSYGASICFRGKFCLIV